MSSVSMDNAKVRRLMSTVDLIAATLDANPDSWRDQLQAIRNITQSLELLDLQPDESRKQWQLPLIEVFQQVAYADADNGGVPDIGNWCLRQAVTLLQVYPGDVDLLTMIGRNWLHRAQKPLSHIHNTERDSNSSGGSPGQPLSRSEEELRDARAAREAEDRLHTGEYVEARGILLPATEYLKRAVDAATTQDRLAGPLLATVAEAYMSLGNVSSPRVNEQYYREALEYLQAATNMADYTLPLHLKQYLEEYGPLINL